jgi:hypothetical protein
MRDDEYQALGQRAATFNHGPARYRSHWRHREFDTRHIEASDNNLSKWNRDGKAHVVSAGPDIDKLERSIGTDNCTRRDGLRPGQDEVRSQS